MFPFPICFYSIMFYITMTKKKPTVSIVIPALNEEKPLEDLLECLKKQSMKDFEVIVADAGSEDGTRGVAEKYGARVVEGGLPGVGRNRGAARASGEYLLFLDADVQIGGDFCKNSMREIEERNIQIGGCEAVPLSDSAFDRIIHKTAFLMMKLTSETNPRLPGYCMFFRRDVFTAVGGFDEEVQLAEDYDLVRRASEIAPLQLLETVQVHVSTRRFDKEGRLPYIGKAVKVFFYRKLQGEIRDGSIEYEFDNFEEEEDAALMKRLKKIEKQLENMERRFGSKRIPEKVKKTAEKLKALLDA